MSSPSTRSALKTEPIPPRPRSRQGESARLERRIDLHIRNLNRGDRRLVLVGGFDLRRKPIRCPDRHGDVLVLLGQLCAGLGIERERVAFFGDVELRFHVFLRLPNWQRKRAFAELEEVDFAIQFADGLLLRLVILISDGPSLQQHIATGAGCLILFLIANVFGGERDECFRVVAHALNNQRRVKPPRVVAQSASIYVGQLNIGRQCLDVGAGVVELIELAINRRERGRGEEQADESEARADHTTIRHQRDHEVNELSPSPWGEVR